MHNNPTISQDVRETISLILLGGGGLLVVASVAFKFGWFGKQLHMVTSAGGLSDGLCILLARWIGILAMFVGARVSRKDESGEADVEAAHGTLFTHYSFQP